MAWIKGFRITKGILRNKVFEFDSYGTDQYSWRIPPNTNIDGNYGVCNVGSGYIGGETCEALGGVKIDPEDYNLDSNPQTLAILPIEGYSGTDYKRELVFTITGEVIQNTGTVIDLVYKTHHYLRRYTDSETYIDVQLGSDPQNNMQFHVNDGTGVNVINAYLLFANVIYNNHHYVLLGSDLVQLQGGHDRWLLECACFDYNYFFQTLGGEPESEETSEEFGPASDIDGGYNDGFPHGSFDDSSDEIGLDAKPTVGVSTAGFIRCYKVNQGDLDDFGEKLFPDPETVPVTERLWFTTAYSKLIDYVIDCHVIPTSISGATVEGLKVGWKTFNDIQLARATEDYVDIDCGTIEIEEYWRNFLDFGNVFAEIYIPFYGFVPIDSEYWNGGKLNLKYRFNIVDGSFQAKLFSTSSKSKLTNSLIGQYGGVCCLHLPITGLQYANVITGILAGGANIAIGAASGNYGGIPNQLANMAALRPENPMSNGYSATTSFLAHRTPYLVIKRAVAQFSTRYNKENGFPLNVARTLSSVHGFTVIDKPVLNIACNDAEYNELVQLLKSGIIL